MGDDQTEPDHPPVLHCVHPKDAMAGTCQPPSPSWADRATLRPWREPLTWKRPILVRRPGCGVPGPPDPEAS